MRQSQQDHPAVVAADCNADVAFADIGDIKALTRMSASWIHNSVRSGEFPAPVVRRPRCTRWRLADVRAWLALQAANPDPAQAELVVANAARASAAARAKRNVAGRS